MNDVTTFFAFSRGKSVWLNLEQFDKKWFEMGQGNNESEGAIDVKETTDLLISPWYESFTNETGMFADAFISGIWYLKITNRLCSHKWQWCESREL